MIKTAAELSGLEKKKGKDYTHIHPSDENYNQLKEEHFLNTAGLRKTKTAYNFGLSDIGLRDKTSYWTR